MSAYSIRFSVFQWGPVFRVYCWVSLVRLRPFPVGLYDRLSSGGLHDRFSVGVYATGFLGGLVNPVLWVFS